MKRLTTLALLAGMLSAPALHSEEPARRRHPRRQSQHETRRHRLRAQTCDSGSLF